jgi:two-component system KDP operon response regulator KdpE
LFIIVKVSERVRRRRHTSSEEGLVLNANQRHAVTGARCHALLIEADEAYRVAIEACIRLAGCRAEAVPDPDSALRLLEHRRFDVVVWGISVPQTDRRETISALRRRTEAPLVLVDAGLEMAQVDLEAGADQWVPKPFAPGALIGSLRAALRKAPSPIMDVATSLEIHGILLDGKRRTLTFAGHESAFTRQEWTLLSILISHPNRFLSVREILGLGWRAGEHEPDQLRIYVRRLRQKVEPMGLPCRLLSQHGQGYCLEFH